MSDAPSPANPAPHSGSAASDLQRQGQQIWAGLSMGGKILMVAGLVGVVSVFLPCYSFSMSGDFGAFKAAGRSNSASAIEVWQGKFGLITFAACAVGAFLLMKPGPNRRNILFGALGAAAASAVLAIWLFSDLGGGGSSTSVNMPGLSVSAGRSIGAFLFLLSGLAAAAGAGLLAKEEKLF